MPRTPPSRTRRRPAQLAPSCGCAWTQRAARALLPQSRAAMRTTRAWMYATCAKTRSEELRAGRYHVVRATDLRLPPPGPGPAPPSLFRADPSFLSTSEVLPFGASPPGSDSPLVVSTASATRAASRLPLLSVLAVELPFVPSGSKCGGRRRPVAWAAGTFILKTAYLQDLFFLPTSPLFLGDPRIARSWKRSWLWHCVVVDYLYIYIYIIYYIDYIIWTW